MRWDLFYTVAGFSRMELSGAMWNISANFLCDLVAPALFGFLAHINYQTNETDKHG